MQVKLKESYTTSNGAVLRKNKAYDAYAMDNGQFAVKYSGDGRVILGKKYIKETIGS